MKILLMSMPDAAPFLIHEAAVHIPAHGIASVGGNIDNNHTVYLADLVRKRSAIRKYVTRILVKIEPELVGLSAMSWQYDTCLKLIRLIKDTLPGTQIVIGGYHATLMYTEIENAPESHLIDYMIRGEGEEACRRLVNALEDKSDLSKIPSLSYKKNGVFCHNKKGELLDLSRIRPPIRDKRRLTWGYHMLYSKIEVAETSRGCTRNCNFCSMRHMYGRSFRTFPTTRILSDLDDIYFKRKTRWVFFVDDNFVLSPRRVHEICDAILARKYKNLNLLVQADCLTMANNEDMVSKMAKAGFRSVFLGIESASLKNLMDSGKGNILSASKKAVALCQRYGIMVIGGLIFGFPDDDEKSIVANYEYFREIGPDAAFCQILTPYPKTDMRRYLLSEGLITNGKDYKKYNGLYANIRTRHLSADQLQYFFWYYRQKVLGWWQPSQRARKQGWGWTSIWIYLLRPISKALIWWTLKKHGYKSHYQKDLKRLDGMNRFKDLDRYT